MRNLMFLLSLLLMIGVVSTQAEQIPFTSIGYGGTEIASNSQPTQQTSPSQVAPADTLITLERTGCFGSCSIYTLKISADETVVFEGKRFVKRAGRVESKITQEQLKELITQFDKAKYFSLRDKYESTEEDAQGFDRHAFCHHIN